VIGISMNTYDFSEERAREACRLATEQTGLPCTDPVRFEAKPLLEAIEQAYRGKLETRRRGG